MNSTYISNIEKFLETEGVCVCVDWFVFCNNRGITVPEVEVDDGFPQEFEEIKSGLSSNTWHHGHGYYYKGVWCEIFPFCCRCRLS